MKTDRQEAVALIAQWVSDNAPADCVLNIAGQRASKAPSIAATVTAFLIDVISKVNGKLFYPIST